MARLQWDSVAAPNLGNADAYSDFSRSVSNALGGLNGAIKEFDGVKTTAANKELMLRLMAEQDANVLKGKLADGSAFAGVNKDRISAETLSAYNARPTQLLSQAAAFRTDDQARIDLERAPVIGALWAAREAGNTEEVKRLQAENPHLFDGMGSGKTIDLMENMSSAERTGLGNRSAQRNFEHEGVTWDDSRTDRATMLQDRAVDREAIMLAEQLRGEYGGDPELTESALNGLYGKVDARILAKVRGVFGTSGVGSFGGGAGGAGGGGAGGAGASYDQFVVALESGGKAGARNPNSSATGLHQFTGDTWLGTIAQAKPAWANGLSSAQLLNLRTDPQKSAEMEQVLRANNASALQNAGLQVNNVNLYAAHHFGAPGGVKFASASDDTPMSAILTPAQLAANAYLQGKTKGQAVANWNQRAAGAALPQVPASQIIRPSVLKGVEPILAQSPLVTQYEQTATNSASPNAVANALSAGALKGTSSSWVLEKVQQIQSRAAEMGHPITAATAGSIVEGSMRRQGFWEGMFKSGTKTLDDDMVEKQLKLVTSNKLAVAVNDVAQVNRGMANSQASEAMAQTAQARLLAARRRGVRNLAPFIADVVASGGQVDTATAALAGETDRVLSGNRGPKLEDMPRRPPVVSRPAAPRANIQDFMGYNRIPTLLRR